MTNLQTVINKIDSAFVCSTKVDFDGIFVDINNLQKSEVWSSLTELQRKMFVIIPEMLRDASKYGIDDAYGYASDLFATLKIDLHNANLI